MTFLSTGIAIAEPPYVEVYYIDMPEADCFERAEASMKEAGFALKEGTWEGYDRVAFKDDYKAVVSCFKEKQVTVIIVAGPVYKTADQYASVIKDNFKYWLKKE
jgi:hypothetical protein